MIAGRRFVRLVGLIAVFGAVTGVALAGTVSWGGAIEVPGIAALNTAGIASTTSVSCPSAGDCTAGGYYTATGTYPNRAFVVDEKAGAWGTAIAVPGLQGLQSSSGYASVGSVSCASAGNCAAGGFYDDSSGHRQAFVVDEKAGVWGTAIEVPGTDALNTGGLAGTGPISCTSPGNCSAGGSYTINNKYTYRGFVVDETNGVWGKAVALPVPAYGVSALSCGSPGNCAAGGYGFLLNERHGKWGAPIEVPGFAALGLGHGGTPDVVSVSCAGAGNCTAGGAYDGRALVISERNGKWGQAIRVRYASFLNHGGSAGVTSVSCATPRDCTAGGWYTDRLGETQAFVVSEKRGVWGSAIKLPFRRGIETFYVNLTGLSCADAGDCAATGSYQTFSHGYAFVADEKHGTWDKAREVPGTEALTQGFLNADAHAVSCARGAGACTVGGSYMDGSGLDQAFVTTP